MPKRGPERSSGHGPRLLRPSSTRVPPGPLLSPSRAPDGSDPCTSGLRQLRVERWPQCSLPARRTSARLGGRPGGGLGRGPGGGSSGVEVADPSQARSEIEAGPPLPARARPGPASPCDPARDRWAPSEFRRLCSPVLPLPHSRWVPLSAALISHCPFRLGPALAFPEQGPGHLCHHPAG
ncbi:uncharacterized protein LOC144576861 [Callithrix jacchus]